MSETVKETLQETAKEAVKSFIKTSEIFTEPIQQRMGHPFIGSFAISWILFNWKPIAYFVFTKSPIEFKIIYIEQNFCNWIFLFLAPFTAACFYTVVLKWWDDLSYRIVQKTIKTKNLNKKNEILTGIDHDIEIVKKRKILENAKAENKDLEELNIKLELLTKELDIKEQKIIGIQQEQLQRLKQLEDFEIENNEIKSELLHYTSQIEFLTKELEIKEQQYERVLEGAELTKDTLMDREIQLDAIKTRSVIDAEKLRNACKTDQFNILNIVRQFAPTYQFSKTIKALKANNLLSISDTELDKLLPKVSNLENSFEIEYSLPRSPGKILNEIIKSLQSLDDRITVEIKESYNLNGQDEVTLYVTYPDPDMIDDLDFIINNEK